MRYLGRKLSKSLNQDLDFSPYSFFIHKVEVEDFYNIILAKSVRLQKVIEKYEVEYDHVYELCLDTYTAMYRYAPQLLPENQVQFDSLLNYGAISQLLEDPKYKNIRSTTQHDEIGSLLGTELFMEKMMEIIIKLKEQFDENLKAYKEAKEAYQKALEEAKANGELGESASTLEEIKKALQEAQEELKNLYKDKAERKVKKAINDVLQNVQQTQEMLSNWGLGHDQTYQRMSYEEKMTVLDKLRNNQKLKKISLLAGKFKEILMEGEKAKTKKTRSHIEDVTMGDDMSRILAHERMQLKHPVLRKHFLQKFSKKQLLQHEYGGKVKKGKGPIVACIDCSGSMGGEREIYAKATALALLEVAKKQKRAFLAIHFDSGQSAKNLKTNTFSKKHPYNIKEVIDLAEYFGGGGTEFEPPLDRAKIEIEKEHEFSKADIVFISDGSSAVRDDWLVKYKEWKKKKNITIFTILIDMGGAVDHAVKEFSDTVKHINEIEHDSKVVARSLFSTLLG